MKALRQRLKFTGAFRSLSHFSFSDVSFSDEALNVTPPTHYFISTPTFYSFQFGIISSEKSRVIDSRVVLLFMKTISCFFPGH